MLNKKFKEVTNHLTSTNSYEFNLSKASEELQELSLALTQLLNKDKNNKQEVIDEIGDVKIRLRILENLFDRKEINKRVNYKIRKFQGYIKQGKYKNRI